MNRKNDAIALLKRHHHRTGLHPGPLLRHNELSAAEIIARLRQQDRELERKDVLSIQVLVQTVIVVHSILQQQGRGTSLARGVAARGIRSASPGSESRCPLPDSSDWQAEPAVDIRMFEVPQ